MQACEKHVSEGGARSVDKYGTIVELIFIMILGFSNCRTTLGELFETGNNIWKSINELNFVAPSWYAHVEEFFPSYRSWWLSLCLFGPHVDKKSEVLSRDLFKVHPISPFHLPRHEITENLERLPAFSCDYKHGNPPAKPHEGDKDEARIFRIPRKQLYETLGLEAIISSARLLFNHRIHAVDLLL